MKSRIQYILMTMLLGIGSLAFGQKTTLAPSSPVILNDIRNTTSKSTASLLTQDNLDVSKALIKQRVKGIIQIGRTDRNGKQLPTALETNGIEN